MTDFSYINYNAILSYGAPYNFINTVRGTGKSMAGKLRGVYRFRRTGEGEIWVRRIEEDTIRTKATFFSSKFFKVTEQIGKPISPDDVRIRGDYAELRCGKSWERFIEFVTLSKCSSERSADDSRYTLLILDEGFVSLRKRNHYQGDEVNDFLDLYDSKRRGDRLQALILGNRESVNNPYLSYFGIEAPPFEWNGIRTYRGGSIAYMQSTVPPPDRNNFDRKVRLALEGTKYGDFKYNGTAKDFDGVHIKPKPAGCTVYCCFDFGYPITAWRSGADDLYFAPGVDKTRTIVTDRQTNYRDTLVYKSTERKRFTFLINARRRNSIYYVDAGAAEIATKLLDEMQI